MKIPSLQATNWLPIIATSDIPADMIS